MNFKSLRWAALSIVVTLASCKTDFDLTSDWKDITVVYGLLNYSDTAQYIKINKAFLDEKTNALQLAQIEDSVFYNALTVQLEERNDAGTVTNSFPLDRVDGNLEGYPKESGTFINTPNWLYKTKQSLSPTRTYKLIITKDDGNTITAETKLVSDFSVSKPFSDQIINMIPGNTSFYTASWKNADNASFYGLTIRFIYTEFPVNNPADSSSKFIDWVVMTDYVPENNAPGATVEYKVPSRELYAQISQYIPVNPDVRRIPRLMDFTFAAGGTDLYTYYLVNQSKLGITSGLVSPDYTNINGGSGIFSSRLFIKANANPNTIHKNTIDSIACNALTRNLNFLNSQGLLCQ